MVSKEVREVMPDGHVIRIDGSRALTFLVSPGSLDGLVKYLHENGVHYPEGVTEQEVNGIRQHSDEVLADLITFRS